MIIDYEQYLGQDLSQSMSAQDLMNALSDIKVNDIVARETDLIHQLIIESNPSFMQIVTEQKAIEQIELSIVDLKKQLKQLKQQFKVRRRAYEDRVIEQMIVLGVTPGSQPASPGIAAMLNPPFTAMRSVDLQIDAVKEQIDTLTEQNNQKTEDVNSRFDELRVKFFESLDNFMKFEQNQAIGSPNIKKI